MSKLNSPLVKEQRQEGTAMVLRLAGDIDLNAAPALRTDLLAAAETRPSKLIVNLSGVNYMDSSGVAALVELLQRTKRNKTALVLTNIGLRVRSVFEIARLDKIFTIKPGELEALSEAPA